MLHAPIDSHESSLLASSPLPRVFPSRQRSWRGTIFHLSRRIVQDQDPIRIVHANDPFPAIAFLTFLEVQRAFVKGSGGDHHSFSGTQVQRCQIVLLLVLRAFATTELLVEVS